MERYRAQERREHTARSEAAKYFTGLVCLCWSVVYTHSEKIIRKKTSPLPAGRHTPMESTRKLKSKKKSQIKTTAKRGRKNVPTARAYIYQHKVISWQGGEKKKKATSYLLLPAVFEKRKKKKRQVKVSQHHLVVSFNSLYPNWPWGLVVCRIKNQTKFVGSCGARKKSNFVIPTALWAT